MPSTGMPPTRGISSAIRSHPRRWKKLSPHVTVPGQAVAGERRWQLFGKTAASRYVVVIFTIRRRLFRTVTAYPMNEAQRKIYAPQIG
jgi:uncharacterized DUF497 family protein